MHKLLSAGREALSLGSKVHTQTLGMYATQQQVLDRVRQEAKPLLISARQVLAARLKSLGIQDGHAKVLAVEQHLYILLEHSV